MKKMKKLIAALLALALVVSLAACGGDSEEPSTAATNPSESATEPSGSSYAVEPLGSGNPKWTEEETADGWTLVTNEGGDTLGYSKNSGISLIQVDGYAFKDLDQDGELDVYEDWRLDNETRARDLANRMSGEEIAPFLTHGGWGTITSDKDIYTSDDNAGYAYLLAGGRAGLARSVGTSPEECANTSKWTNIIQELCEGSFYGIPGLVSIDPNGQSNMVQCLSMAATMDPELAFEVGKAYSAQYRAMGVNVLLGPQVDLITTPVMDRSTGTFTEDPALARDITEAFISGLQSTYTEDGTDLGWGSDSVVSVVKHYVGGGASEFGGDDHNQPGKYSTFPGGNFEAHLIPFFDGAFNLTHSSTGAVAGLMTAYTATYSADGSLGENVGSAWSEYKWQLLAESGWSGFVVSDWTIYADAEARGVCWGVEDYTEAERIALSIELGITQAGGYSDLDKMAEVWEIVCDDLGEEAALEMFRDRAYENILVTLKLGLFENPYCSTERARELCYSTDALAFGLETQLASIVMVKNDGTIKEATADGEKPTAYIPYMYVPATGGMFASPATFKPSVDLDLAAEYYNIITDTVGEPSGTDNDGKPAYTANDIIRASAAEIASCDIILVGMTGPHTGVGSITDEDGNIIGWTPPSNQYAEYTATTARDPSIAGDLVTNSFFDGYTQQTKVETENRSYKGQTSAKDKNYSHLEVLQYAASNAAGVPVVVMMNMSSCATMVWTEVEPLADAILVGYGVTDEAFLLTVTGQHEPNGLLVAQMPASMEACEDQLEDVPRDVECYVDANGNTYDFAFGLNWSGVIDDERVRTYTADPLTECEAIAFHYAN